MTESLSDKLRHELRDIMTRNYQIAEFSIPNGSAAGTILYTLDPGTIFNNTLNIANKLTGFLCVHADIEIELRYNVEPQAVGGIALAQFYPQAKSIAEINNLNGNQMLWSAISTPVNLLTETSSKTTIKYLSTSMTFSPNILGDVSQQGFWPRFQIYMWSPYVSPTTTDLQLTVYARLKNVMPMIPTILMIKPPTTLERFNEFYKLLREKVAYRITKEDLEYVNDYVREHMDMAYAQTGSDTELKEEKGTISEVITTINDIVQKVPNAPIIKEIKEEANVTLPFLAGRARYYGYSKPEDHKIAVGSEQMNSVNMNNIDGAVNSYNLANSAHQRRAVASLSRNQNDGLAFSEFASRFAYFNRFTIGRTTAPNTVVYKQDISPFRFSAGSSPNQFCTPLSFVSLFHKYWSGDIILRIRAFANQFVNYNLQMGVAYGVASGDITNTTDLSNVYNYILDGKQMATFDYRIEFKSQNPWKETLSQLPSFTTATNKDSVGCFVIRLQNAFTSSSSTVDSIDITVEVACADNIQFNVLQHVPYNFQTPPTQTSNESLSEAFAQTADANSPPQGEHCDKPTLGIDQATSIKDTYTFGQSIKSFKQILNTEQFLQFYRMVSPADVPNNYGDLFAFWPYNAIHPNDDNSPQYTYLSIICQPFAFLSGDLMVSYHKFDNSFNMNMDMIKFDPHLLPSDIDATLVNNRIVGLSSSDNQTRLYMNNLGSNIIVQNLNQSRKAFRVPNLLDRTVFLRPTGDGGYETGVSNHFYPSGAVIYGNPTLNSNTVTYPSTQIYIYVRGADNFMCHFFNGLTEMYYNPTFMPVTPVKIS